ncbi:MAG TPA: sterol desaturase family protein [Polyangia bacterium]
MIDLGFVRSWSLSTIAAVTSAGLLVIYFGFGAVGWWATRSLFPRLGWGQRIALPELPRGQVGREMRAALGSIAIFAGWGVLTLLAERRGWVTILWQVDWRRVPLELAAITLWNEVHFYATHRLLHTRWLFKHVHRHHHRSIQATPFSGYSMHPAEAVILGSVMLSFMLVVPLSPVTMMVFPAVSLAFNVLGHLSYDLAPGRGAWHPATATRRHALHHTRVAGNYGFMLPVLDRVCGTTLPER